MKKIYSFLKKVPKGKITTYGTLAKKVKTSPRAVGKLMNVNPYKDVPCHRVVMSDGQVGGFASGVRKKIKLLKREGISIRDNRISNFERVLFKF